MNLIDNEEKKSKEQNTKLLKIIIIAIVVLVLILVAVLSYSMYLQSKQFRFLINDRKTSIPSDLLVYEDNTLYISIKDMASLLDFEYNNGEYKKFDEDVTKGYVEDNICTTIAINIAKNDLSKEDFIEMCKKVANNFTFPEQ